MGSPSPRRPGPRPRRWWRGTARASSSPWNHRPAGGDLDVLARRVSPAGVLVDHTALPIATSPVDEDSVSIAAGPTGRVAIAFDRFADARYGQSRAFFRFLDER
jgi:hypothetical protein